MDPRSFCDHGTWTGPCSSEKHAAVRAGIGKDYETQFSYALRYTRVTPDGVRCACCRYLYEAAGGK